MQNDLIVRFTVIALKQDGGTYEMAIPQHDHVDPVETVLFRTRTAMRLHCADATAKSRTLSQCPMKSWLCKSRSLVTNVNRK